jgi:hypothetical protein
MTSTSTLASSGSAAGGVYIGHGDVRQTWNRYGHLMPGDEVTAAAQLDALLEPVVAR